MIDVSLEVEDDQGLVRWKNQTISIVDFPVSDFTTVSNISGQSTIRLDTNYTVNETLTWRPNWADAEVANKVIGVGLAFNLKGLTSVMLMLKLILLQWTIRRTRCRGFLQHKSIHYGVET